MGDENKTADTSANNNDYAVNKMDLNAQNRGTLFVHGNSNFGYRNYEQKAGIKLSYLFSVKRCEELLRFVTEATAKSGKHAQYVDFVESVSDTNGTRIPEEHLSQYTPPAKGKWTSSGNSKADAKIADLTEQVQSMGAMFKAFMAANMPAGTAPATDTTKEEPSFPEQGDDSSKKASKKK